uniref:DNA ligase n=1 Tax=Photinus pyralis TaxID=7054 RepID=A0A1Y1KHU9_PHOPY
MSDAEDNTNEKAFVIDRAKQGRAACKKCKAKCVVAELRIAKVVPSPFGAGKMNNWYHLDCMFEQFLKQRATTLRIQSAEEIDGFDNLDDADKADIINRIKESEKNIAQKYGLKAPSSKPNTPKASPKKATQPVRRNSASTSKEPPNKDQTDSDTSDNRDLLFRGFRRVVADISNVSSYTDKTNVVKKIFTSGSNGKGFKGNITQWCRLLLPGDCKRIYNLQSKQLIKLFSKMFGIDQSTMMEYLKQNDMGDTIFHFFEQSKKMKPSTKSSLSINEVDGFLEQLSQLSKEDDQINHFKTIIPKCTANDLKIIVRLIKHDLRMNAGAKHILQGVHPDAYEVYQSSKDLNSVIKRCINKESVTQADSARLKASITVMTPIQPMLAEACKSIEQAMKKCPNGMYAEIKYDGERVQLHKHGNEFKYFSRSLKPVLPHKVSHFKNYIPKAFPHAKDLILDSEILMIDTVSGKPLPFGTLGIHKKSEFKDANVCLFVFDCIYYNGKSLVSQPIEYRKKVLKENMTEIPNRIVFSELETIHKPNQLSSMIGKVLEMGLEGLVLKDLKSIYEPGKRHWLKVKKDYLNDGAMADTADLIVLGAWYGTGKKAGMMSVFLMGCYDHSTEEFCTVTKVHTGHDDKTLEKLQTELKMVKINSEPANVPAWLKCTRTMIPDFVAEDPRQQPVWEITGAEFTQHDVHTADGISIRFPRVTKIRSDKSWKEATSLTELKKLFHTSKDNTDIKLRMNADGESDTTTNTSTSPKKSSKSPNGSCKQKKEVDETEAPSKKQKIETASELSLENKIKEPLANLFENVKLLVEEGGQKQFETCLRYFIAYGGTVLKSEQWEETTHVLHLEDTVFEQSIVCPKSARHIISEWILTTVSKGELQDFRPYTVRWEPVT